MASEVKVVAGQGSFQTQWTYNSAGMVALQYYPNGSNNEVDNAVQTTYLPGGAVNSVFIDPQPYFVASTTYDDAGRVDLRTLGSAPNQLQTDYDYQPWNVQGGRMDTIHSGTTGSPTSLQDLNYTYDPNGNILTITDNHAQSQVQTFTYDDLNRLSTAQAAGGNDGNYAQETYVYDGTTGNLTNKGGVTQAYTDTNHKHAVTSAGGNTYTYRCNGKSRGNGRGK